MAQEYIIPLGVDGSNIAKGVQEMTLVMEKLEEKGGEVGKALDEGFQKGTKASENLDKSIKNNAKNLETIKEAGKLAGKELAEAFKSGNTSDMEKKIENFKEKLGNITAKVDIKLDDDKIRIFEKEILGAKDDIEALNIVLRQSQQILDTLDPNSAEYQALSEAISFTTTALNEFEQEVVQTVDKSKSMKAELLAIKQELEKLESEGKAGSEMFLQLSKRAGELKDQIGDTAAQIAILSSDTKHIDALISGVQGLAGAFTLVQGATALWGDENEDLQKALLKVNGAMAVLQGLQSVMNTLNKDSAFNVVFLRSAKQGLATTTGLLSGLLSAETAATSAATLATKAFSFALKTIGIGLVISAIALLVEYWDELTGAMNDLLPAGQSVGKMFDKLKSYVMGVGNVILQYAIAPIKALWLAINGDLSGAMKAMGKQFDVVNNFNAGFQMQTKKNNEKYAMEAKEQRMKEWDENIQLEEARGKDMYQSRKKWHENNIAMLKKQGKDTSEAIKEYRMFLAKHDGDMAKDRESARKKAEADAKRQAEEAKRKREQAQKDAEQQAKKDAQLVETYGRELAKIRIEQIEDQYQKEREKIQEETENKIEDLKKDGAKSAEAIQARNALIKGLLEEEQRKLKELEKKHNIEILNEKLDQQKALLDLAKDGQEKELALLDNEHQRKMNDIETKYAKETEFKIKLLQAESEAYERKKKEITDKYAMEDLQKQEEIQLLTIELSSKYANQSEKTERQKQIAILETKIEFAEKALALLQVQGKEENSIEVLNARKTIQDLKKSLGEEIAKNDGQGFDIFEFLGLGDKFTSEQKTKIKQAFASIVQSLRQITDFVIQQYERQIEAKQKVIDQLDEEIGNLQDRLEEEKSLKEEGLANDVENIERQLAEKQRQKDEEIKQQEELVKKKKELQRIEMIADTAYQAVGLITASVDIFKSFAKLPFGIGIPLAIAVVGTMLGAFAAAKIKAFQAVNDGQKFQKGGTIRGKLHAQGGEKFYSLSGENIELEEGEKVTNRISSKKYGNLLDAINTDDFSRLPITDGGLRELFRKMGLTFQTDEIFKASKLNAGLKTIVFSKDTETLAKINEGIQYLVQEAKDTPKSWEDDLFFYLKKGNKITKIPKKDEAEK